MIIDNGVVVNAPKYFEVKYGSNNEILLKDTRRNIQIRMSPVEQRMTCIRITDGVAKLISHQTIENAPVSGVLLPGAYPTFHNKKYVDWCKEHKIGLVRHKKPERFSMIGTLSTDGLVHTETDIETGEQYRIVENETWVVHRTKYDAVLYTRKSIYSLDI